VGADVSDPDFGDDEVGEGDEVERRGVVWVTFVKDRDGTVTYPMPGVPRVGEIVDLSGGQLAPADLWRVVQVVWNVPFGFDQKDLPKLTLASMTAVNVHVERVPEQRRR
jgi:hypothetical protein